MKQLPLFVFILVLFGCKGDINNTTTTATVEKTSNFEYSKGFSIEKTTAGTTIITVKNPWPNSETSFKYLLIPKEIASTIRLNKNEYDAIINIPVDTIVVTSTTHIPALEALGVLDALKGFPDTKYISSKAARVKIANGSIVELGSNESLNTEAVLALQPDVVIGFTISSDNNTYKTLQRSGIPVVYNGDWVEETPLGKAEWIKFFAPFFGKEKVADSIFNTIESSYLHSKKLAQNSVSSPTVLGGAMYKDIWYLPGGKSWAATFLKDANANYMWNESPETGSLSLSWEHVLNKAKDAEYWIGPGQFTSYDQLKESSQHYTQFASFKNEKIYSFSNTVGATGGVLYYELAPQRPDIVLKDLIHIFHPDVLPDHVPFFFKPLN